MILFLHNRYRVPGGEERAVADLAWLVRDRLGEPAELLERDSTDIGSARAARALLRGGEDPQQVADTVRRTGARIVHAHNLNPSFGPRALAAAREAGAKVVLHLHNYRLVCAVGTCVDPAGEDCTRCHGRNTTPGLARNCRGSRPEALVYAAALARQAASLVAHADAIIVPSEAARSRLLTLGAPLADTPVHVVGHVLRDLDGPSPPPPVRNGYALVASRLAPEKAVDIAIDAAVRAGVELVVAGDGPERAALEQRAAGADVRFVGRVEAARLVELRAGAGVALVPTRAHETFGLAALESMAAGLPTVATGRGALAELGDGAELVAPEDPAAMARAMTKVLGDPTSGQRGRALAVAVAAPDVIAPQLAAVYTSL